MGLLSKLLPVAGAVVGNAILPGIGGQIGGALGGAAGGALSKSGGSKAATKAQLKAIEDAKAAAAAGKTEALGYLKPGLDTYQPGVNALTARFGLGSAAPPATRPYDPNGGERGPLPPGAGLSSTPMASNGAGPVMDTFDPKEAARSSGTMGSGNGVIDMAPGPDGVYAAAPTTNALTGAQPGTYGSETNPVAPGAYQAPTAPGGFSFDVNDFVNSPILQAALKRGTGAAEASTAARGSLFSGATLKALTDYGLDSSYKFFDNERDFAYGMNRDARGDYQDDRDFGYGMSRDGRRDYEDQRNYLTGRFDRGTEDLFRYTGIGERAASGSAGIAGDYGNQMVDLALGRGEAKANNALTQGGIWSDFAGDVGGTLAGIYGGSSLDNDVRRLAAANPKLF